MPDDPKKEGEQPNPEKKADDKKPDDKEFIDKKTHEETLNKIRADEKKKVQSRLEQLEAEKKAAEERAAKVIAEAEEAKKRLKDKEDQSLTDAERTTKKLQELELSRTDFEKKLKDVEAQASARIAAFELEAHREKALRKASLSEHLVDLVAGNTKDEIDASIARLKEKEEALRGSAAKETEERVKKELGKNVPGPINPGKDDDGPVSYRARLQTAKVRDPAAYAKARADMLEKAKKEAGLK